MTNVTRNAVRAHLERLADDEPVYISASEIAAEFDGSAKAVAYYLAELEGEMNDLMLERWGRSTSITWKLTRQKGTA